MIRLPAVTHLRAPLAGWLAILAVGASSPAWAAPRVTIASPQPGWTAQRTVRIAGRVESRNPAPGAHLLFNGVPQPLALKSGEFEVDAVLAAGANEARIVAWDSDGTAVASVRVHATLPPNDLRVVVTWDDLDADVDLAIVGPDGERCDQDRPATRGGGRLDLDVSDGGGPETFTLPHAPRGRWLVELKLFAAPNDRPVRCRIDLFLHEDTAREEHRIVRAVLSRAENARVVTEAELP